MSEHIYPIDERLVARVEKEHLLRQRGRVLWFYGLSGSGKSTIATALERSLHTEGRYVVLLDGDNLRTGLNQGLGFTDADRAENIRRAAEVARLLVRNGAIVLCSFITPKQVLRAQARQIIGAEDFSEIYVRADFETCRRRDPKGLYAKVAAGQVGQFTGKDSGFEEPAGDEPGLMVLDTEQDALSACVARARSCLSA